MQFYLIFYAWNSELNYALSSLLDYRNHEWSLGRGITLQIEKGIRLYLPSYVHISVPTYIGLDHAYATLTLHMHAEGQKNPSCLI